MTEIAFTPTISEQALLQELNHRISNEFQSALSLVSLRSIGLCRFLTTVIALTPRSIFARFASPSVVPNLSARKCASYLRPLR